MAEAGFKARLSGAGALISSSHCLPRGAAVSQVVCASLGAEAARARLCWWPASCHLGWPCCVALSQPCVPGSWLCLGHPWGPRHSRAHPTAQPIARLGPRSRSLGGTHICAHCQGQDRGPCLQPQKQISFLVSWRPSSPLHIIPRWISWLESY